MKRIKVKQAANVPLFKPESFPVESGDEFDIEEQAYFKTQTASGIIWLPENIITGQDAAAIDSHAADSDFSTAAGEDQSVPPASTPSAGASSQTIDIQTYPSPCFQGKTLHVDRDFLEHIKQLEQWLVELELKMHITSSLRNRDAPVRGAIVMPAKRSNHLVGHAVDMNLICRDIIYNSSRLKAFRLLPVAIREFIARIRLHPYLRWGGDFSTPDPVHIDDNLSRRDPERWEAKFVDLYAA